MASYRMYDFLLANEVLVSPDIQNRAQYPFTMQAAKRFFDNFIRETFDLDADVKSIVVYDGKENLPRHSYASAFLFSYSLDEMQEMDSFPDPVGSMHMEIGGNTLSPVIRVTRM